MHGLIGHQSWAALGPSGLWLLGQIGPASPSGRANTPPPLPLSPTLDRLLFEHGWMLPIVLAAAAIIVQRVLYAQGRGKASWIVLTGLMLVALAAGLTSRVVETEREALRRLTTALVETAARGDTRALAPMLAPEAQARDGSRVLPEPFADAIDREAILERVDRYLNGSWKLKSWVVREVQATLDGPRVGRTQVRVTTTPEQVPFPFGSWWRIDWRRGPGEHDAWQAFAIEPVSFDRPGSAR
jgi:hypothetical protein